LDGVTSLLDKSLLVQMGQQAEGPRLFMLETVREYGVECLAGLGEAAAVRKRHAHYFLRVAEEAETHLYSAEREVWLERLEYEDANLRAALVWCKETQSAAEIGLRLAGALSYYWFLQGAEHEGRAWLEAMLTQTGNTDRSSVRGRALFGAGLLAWIEGDIKAATRYEEESISIAREAGNKRDTAYAEVVLGLVQSSQGNRAAARHLFEASHTLLKDLGDAWGTAFTLYHMGRIAYLSDDRVAARAHYEESVRLFRQQGDVRYASLVLSGLQVIVSSQGDEEMARSLYQQSLPLMQQARNRGRLGLFLINNGDMWFHLYGDEHFAKVLYRQGLSLWRDMQQGEQRISIVKALAGLAEIAAAQGKAERAGRLFWAAATLLPSDSMYRENVNGRVAMARLKLDAATFEAGWRVGQAMTQEQAMTDALQDGL
jgi:tetratricopeptide (TPR) repeat protein